MVQIKPVKIANKFVGDGYPCFTISEIGINYEKNLDLAKKMIDMSKGAGFDSVKFQVFSADKMYSKKAGNYNLEGKKINIYKEMERVAMPLSWLKELKEYSDKAGIIFFASPFDEKSADVLEKIDVPVYKIASYELTNIPLLKHIAKKKKPMILSTGGAYLGEIENAIRSIKEEGNDQLILMQCVAKYPAPLEASNLLTIKTMKQAFQIPTGFSDNGSGFMNEDIEKYGKKSWILAPLISTMVGSNILEKHTTLDRNLPGNDQKYSIEEKEQKEMIEQIRNIEKKIHKGIKIKNPPLEILGNGIKGPDKSEEYVRGFAYKKIFSLKKIKKGEILNKNNLKIVRPGKIKGGIDLKFYYEIEGKARANKNIPEDSIINFKDIIINN